MTLSPDFVRVAFSDVVTVSPPPHSLAFKNIPPFTCFLDPQTSFRIRCPTARRYLHPVSILPCLPRLSFLLFTRTYPVDRP